MSDEREDLAEDRTDLAEDRTLLAHERSYAGWVRTGMASVGIGLGFNALFGSIEPSWVPRALATAFLAVAAFVFITAERRARRGLARLKSHKVATLQPMRMRLLSWTLVAITGAVAAALWLLSADPG
ncbi:DUF202 domain-containing protein [Sphingomonas sp. IW22]|uniref:DUF202 domain-containing protein n=1 Tax=Sphingomonas sp. IW22 TaxID=3242489 RepID=UPI00351FFC4F